MDNYALTINSCKLLTAFSVSVDSTAMLMETSDEPWAMASTLTLLWPNWVKICPATPGVLRVPVPTTVMMATSSVDQTRSISRSAISVEKTSSSASSTAAAASVGTAKQIDCSEE